MSSRSPDWPRIERGLVVLIALHSYAVALFLLFLTRWGLELGGWSEAFPLFFPRQSGIFHAVVATGYLWEHVRYRGVGLLLIAKSAAVLFLLTMSAFPDATWVVPLSAVGDGAMGLAVAWIHRKVAGATS